VYCNRSESAGNRDLAPASVILIVAGRAENASIDSCHVALMTILIFESTDSDSSRRFAMCMSIDPKQCISKFTAASRGLRCYCTPLVAVGDDKKKGKERKGKGH